MRRNFLAKAFRVFFMLRLFRLSLAIRQENALKSLNSGCEWSFQDANDGFVPELTQIWV